MLRPSRMRVAWLTMVTIGGSALLINYDVVELEVTSDSATRVVAIATIGLATGGFGWRAFRRARASRIGDWRDAEYAVARWLHKAGCRSVSMTGASADGGIDVITRGWAVQVKHTAKRVGRPALQQLVGAALSTDRRAALFSTSGFSAPAYDYAEEHQVALFELRLDGSARGVNRHARAVGRR